MSEGDINLSDVLLIAVFRKFGNGLFISYYQNFKDSINQKKCKNVNYNVITVEFGAVFVFFL